MKCTKVFYIENLKLNCILCALCIINVEIKYKIYNKKITFKITNATANLPDHP